MRPSERENLDAQSRETEMGYYIEVPLNLNKAGQLRDLHGAKFCAPPNNLSEVPDNKILICVVQNGLYDAAGICFDQREYEDFRRPEDKRRKDWMLMERAKVIELCPHVEPSL
jgi:hypothetical protein